MIQTNLKEVEQNIIAACEKSGRNRDEITLIAVSKTKPVSLLEDAYHAGIRDFGENKVQEMCEKYEVMEKDIRWHMIGHLQTNKVKHLVSFVHMIHSVDSLRLLETINREAEKIGRRVKVLLEVHVAKEESKSGFTPTELLSIANSLIDSSSHSLYPWVEICGIMGMATNTEDDSEWRRCFREIKSLASHLSPIASSPEISMGMSNDYLVAIEEGSTMVRIGSTIFGERQY